MTLKMVIIDYEIGNVRSISNAFNKIGVNPVLSNDRDEILNADGVILPGVGAFAQGMANLYKYSLVDTIIEYVRMNKPLLGVCLGMQVLFEESEEFGITKGLGLIEGRVVKLPVKKTKTEKLPHVSWNEIQPKLNDWNRTILDNIKMRSDMYFVHSYAGVPKNEEDILSTTVYSDHEFCSSVRKDNVYGCQFHPEKSAQEGLKIIENFANICRG